MRSKRAIMWPNGPTEVSRETTHKARTIDRRGIRHPIVRALLWGGMYSDVSIVVGRKHRPTTYGLRAIVQAAF